MALQKRNSNEKKRIWGFEDIQADTNTQQQGAEVDTDTMQNSSSSQKKTINTQKQKKREGTKQAALLIFSVGFERQHSGGAKSTKHGALE